MFLLSLSTSVLGNVSGFQLPRQNRTTPETPPCWDTLLQALGQRTRRLNCSVSSQGYYRKAREQTSSVCGCPLHWLWLCVSLSSKESKRRVFNTCAGKSLREKLSTVNIHKLFNAWILWQGEPKNSKGGRCPVLMDFNGIRELNSMGLAWKTSCL